LYILNDSIEFPPVEQAYEDGQNQPIMWFSPDPRMVLFEKELKVSKSMRQLIRKNEFEVTFNTHFEEVIDACAAIQRPDQEGTWITDEMKKAYTELYKLEYVISVEVWKASELVGGLYGVWLEDKKVFCGESMFAKVSNASKYGFIALVQWLSEKGVKLIDCQVYTKHLASLGAREIPRKEFLKYLK